MLEENFLNESNLKIGYLLCFVTAVGFICSLTYNYGYFWDFNAGIRLLSIGDILTSYTLWVPTLGTLMFLYGLDIFIKRVEIDKKEKKLLQKSKHPKLIKFLIALPQVILICLIILMLTAYGLFGYFDRPIILGLGLILLWTKLLGSILKTKPAKEHFNKYFLSLFMFIPAMLVFMFTLGLDRTLSESELTTPNAVVYFKERPSQEFPTILLRHLEKGLLTKQIKYNDYMLVAWDDISRIEILKQNHKFKGILCESFQYCKQ